MTFAIALYFSNAKKISLNSVINEYCFHSYINGQGISIGI